MAKTLVYQLNPIAWENQGGKNPISAMMDHLERIKALDVDCVWLGRISPWPVSEIKDHGRMELKFGSYAELVKFINQAHKLDLRVIFTLDLNDTAGLRWFFPNGSINRDLIYEFQKVVDFWHDLYRVDGFALESPQSINNSLSNLTDPLGLGLYDIGPEIKVIDGIFRDYEDLFLLMECIDPTNGNFIEAYYCETDVNFVLETSLKNEIEKNPEKFEERLSKMCENPVFMLNLESRNSLRFLARCDYDPEDIIWEIFNSNAEAVCLYQGQELCLGTSGRKKSSPHEPVPLEEYANQEKNPSSYLNLTKIWIRRWKGE